LDSAGVAVVEGAAYGLSPYFRLSFAVADHVLEAALQRIEQAVGTLGPALAEAHP
jgi:aspartate aminotransferase